MQNHKPVVEKIEYRIALIEPKSRNLMAINVAGDYHLPTISIPSLARPAHEIVVALKVQWGLHALVLDFLPSAPGFPYCAIAELLCPDSREHFTPIPLHRIQRWDFSEEQWTLLRAFQHEESEVLLARMGWIDEAIGWVESETGKKIQSRLNIEQYNAGGAFALVRFHSEDGCNYWLKATGEPNVHELSVTKLLSELGGEYLPALIATKPAWNAWLTFGESERTPDPSSEHQRFILFLGDAVTRMAELQLKVRDRCQELQKAGIFDQTVAALHRDSEALFDYIEGAMSLQTARHVPRLNRQRLQQLRSRFQDVCRRMEDLEMPDALVHGDLTLGSILSGDEHCKFTDWSEACIGNPFISLQHLLLLNKVDDESLRRPADQDLKSLYSDVWLPHCSSVAIDTSLRYMPILGIISALYGRGDWFESPLRHEPRRQAYVRSLTRHLDRATQSLEMSEAICL